MFDPQARCRATYIQLQLPSVDHPADELTRRPGAWICRDKIGRIAEIPEVDCDVRFCPTRLAKAGCLPGLAASSVNNAMVVTRLGLFSPG